FQYVRAATSQKAANPIELSNEGNRTGPFPTSDSTSARVEARSPTPQLFIAYSYFGPLSDILPIQTMTIRTKSPTTDATLRPIKAVTNLHAGEPKRCCDLNDATHPQISEGTGRM